jgi:hypothetical protein
VKLDRQTSSGKIPPRPSPREELISPLAQPKLPWESPQAVEADLGPEPWRDQRVLEDQVEVWEEKPKNGWSRFVDWLRSHAI